MPPKVFVSHASEDKVRFVNAFAERLRQSGVDPWLDRWEMLPGDSLVDKIFEEGLKDAKAVVVVLSKFSVDKPWVREELNAAIVKRINTGSKLIPVLIDDCEVPEALKSILWERISDLNSYQPSLDRIVAAIFGVKDKAPLGTAPAYTQSFLQTINGLTKIDSLVLKIACEQVVAQEDDIVDPTMVYCKEGEFLIPEGELRDSMEMLEQYHHIRILRTIGRRLDHFRITASGFEAYAQACIPRYQQIVADVVSALVNKQMTDNNSIAEILQKPLMLVNHILDILESNGHLKQLKPIGKLHHIYSISPSLRRSLQH